MCSNLSDKRNNKLFSVSKKNFWRNRWCSNAIIRLLSFLYYCRSCILISLVLVHELKRDWLFNFHIFCEFLDNIGKEVVMLLLEYLRFLNLVPLFLSVVKTDISSFNIMCKKNGHWFCFTIPEDLLGPNKSVQKPKKKNVHVKGKT